MKLNLSFLLTALFTMASLHPCLAEGTQGFLDAFGGSNPGGALAGGALYLESKAKGMQAPGEVQQVGHDLTGHASSVSHVHP